MNQGESNPLVSVVIATRNRWEELPKAIASCLAQDYRPLEILVYDDASDEDISAEIREKFPEVRFYRSSSHVGQTALKTKGCLEANGDFLFMLDDDALYTDPATITQVVKLMQNCPDVALMAMPFIEPLYKHAISYGLDLNEGQEKALRALIIPRFIGAVHALRRRAALAVGGYRDFLFGPREEEDLAIRLMDKGWLVITANVPAAAHLLSPKRDLRRLHVYGPRGSILFAFLNVPFPFIVSRIIMATLGALWHGWRIGELRLKIMGLFQGYGACLKYFRHRQPVSRKTWARFRALERHPEPLIIPALAA